MAFILPFWLTFGRALFGAGGWATFILMFTFVPVLLTTVAMMSIMLNTRADVKASGKLQTSDSLLLLLLYLSVILHGFFMIDGGDTPESNSVAATLFGDGMFDVAEKLGEDTLAAGVFSTASMVLLVVCIIVFGYKRFLKKYQ